MLGWISFLCRNWKCQFQTCIGNFAVFKIIHLGYSSLKNLLVTDFTWFLILSFGNLEFVWSPTDFDREIKKNALDMYVAQPFTLRIFLTRFSLYHGYSKPIFLSPTDILLRQIITSRIFQQDQSFVVRIFGLKKFMRYGFPGVVHRGVMVYFCNGPMAI